MYVPHQTGPGLKHHQHYTNLAQRLRSRRGQPLCTLPPTTKLVPGHIVNLESWSCVFCYTFEGYVTGFHSTPPESGGFISSLP